MKRTLYLILLFLVFQQTLPLEAQTKKTTTTQQKKSTTQTKNATQHNKSQQAEEEAGNTVEPSWQLVVGGAPVGNPLVTEYGFAVPLEGRTMAAVSEDGRLMWFAGLPGSRISPHSSTGTGDFLITVSGGNAVSLINPSGLTLWSAKAPAEIISTPIQGRDGRIYVQCPREVACFGINGTLKWATPAGESSGIPLMELEDGSILHIQKKTLQGCSTALRYSPFGVILEELTFSGKVTSAITTKYGVILVFTDGSLGCISSKNNAAQDSWTLPAGSIGGSAAARLFLDRLQSICAVVTPADGQTTVTYLNPQDGTISLSTTVPVDTNRIAFGTFDRSSLVLCDTTRAVGVSLEGEVTWESTLPGTMNWSHILYLPQGYLAMLEKDSWVIKAYRVTQHIGLASQTTTRPERNTAFPVYVEESSQRAGLPQSTEYLFGRLISEEYMDDIKWELERGEYNDQEGQWLALVNLEMHRLFSKYTIQSVNPMEASFMEENMGYFEDIIKLMSSFESGCFNKELARIVRLEKDPAILSIVLGGIANVAYDPTFELLESIESLLTKHHLISNSRITALMCNATYEICRFMGKPALFTKGRYILSYLLNQNLDSGTKLYATATMRKIIALEM
ncbi:MAG: hypothetical protein IKA80_05700 [Spirochaetaceae bacterium]|nr:hypothetical protein [Spirochaetaceae bacterium]